MAFNHYKNGDNWVENPLRKDDYVGIKVVKRMTECVSQAVLLVESETVPESFLDQIVDFNPTHILIVDAALLNKKAGSVEFSSPKILVDTYATSTHLLPLRIFCDYLETTTNAKIVLTLIQPKLTEFGEGLTVEVKNASIRVADHLTELLQ